MKNTDVCEVTHGQGYVTGQMANEDFDLIYSAVDEMYRRNLKDMCTNLPEMSNYHLMDLNFNHSNFWTKSRRLLNRAQVESIMQTSFFHDLQSKWGRDLTVTDEEEIGFGNMYWRLVRPNMLDDVGSVHADKWFWEISGKQIPNGFMRIKIWIPIISEPGKNGFYFYPNTQRTGYRYEKILKGGLVKPFFDENQMTEKRELFEGGEGEYIVFNDSLLHGGFVGGNQTRVSLEFTLCVRACD